MKQRMTLVVLSILILSCGKDTAQNASNASPNPLRGTWQLVSGTVIENGDTIVTDYTKDKSFIKIINDTHFAFLLHDLTAGNDSAALFASGGGTYTLKDREYTEHLAYCSDREWEGHDFTFNITVTADSLKQEGVEQVESAGVNRVNIERYVKVKE